MFSDQKAEKRREEGAETDDTEPHLKSWKVANSIEAKIVLLGDSAVGKTSIAVRYARGAFLKTSNPTIGASFFTKTIVVGSSDSSWKIKLQVWDVRFFINYFSFSLIIILFD